jgi:hypothetical protein
MSTLQTVAQGQGVEAPCLPVAPVTKMIRSLFFDMSSISFDRR